MVVFLTLWVYEKPLNCTLQNGELYGGMRIIVQFLKPDSFFINNRPSLISKRYYSVRRKMTLRLRSEVINMKINLNKHGIK